MKRYRVFEIAIIEYEGEAESAEELERMIGRGEEHLTNMNLAHTFDTVHTYVEVGADTKVPTTEDLVDDMWGENRDNVWGYTLATEPKCWTLYEEGEEE